MATIIAGQRADADRVHNMSRVHIGAPVMPNDTRASNGEVIGAWHLQNTWVSGWVRIVEGPDNLPETMQGAVLCPVPIDTSRVRWIREGNDMIASTADPVGWGKIVDSSDTSNSRVVSVFAGLSIWVIFNELGGPYPGLYLRYAADNVTGLSGEPFSFADGDVATYSFSYPAAGHELAGRLD